MESKTLPTLKPLSKVKEMNLRSLKLKEESISTILTTIKSNQKFAKLLIFTLNSLQGFVTPPNREIRANARIIIKLNGIATLHLISGCNITKDDIIASSGDILYKLIYMNDILDKELTKFFAEKDGYKVVIDIILKTNKNLKDTTLLPYIKIINGLTQIPQLIPTLIENNVINAINLNIGENELDNKNKDNTYNKNIILIKLNTLKQISTQKIGREYLIKNNFAKKIINALQKCAEEKDVDSVLSCLGIVENLCRNEEGVKELKNLRINDCLNHVFNLLGYEQSIIKRNAKIYYKIASAEDLKAQLELLKKYYEENKTPENIDKNLSDINKILELVSNFILVDELCLMLKEEDNFELIKNLFIQIQQINSENKSKEFINSFIAVEKNFMNIFYRLFSLVKNLMENNEELYKNLINSIKKNWELVNKNIDEKNSLIIFDSYFSFYGEIFNQYIQNNKDKLNNEVVENLIYINKNILISGEKYLNVDESNLNPHRIACILMKICSEIAMKENTNEENINNEKKDELIKSLEDCYPYLEFLFITMEDEEILSYSLELIYDLVNSKKDFKENKLNQIVNKICDFMMKKCNQRNPCLKCMKLFDMFLSKENEQKDSTQKIKYVDSVVTVMTYSDIEKDKDIKSINIENEINELGNTILEKLIDENDFNKILKEFCDNTESFEPNKNNKDAIQALENCIKRMAGIIELKNYYEIGSDSILTSLKKLLEKEIKYIEIFKRDKSKEKNQDFNSIIENTSSRIITELNLNLKIGKISQQKNNLEIYVRTLDIIFLSLTKLSDKRIIKYLLNNLKSNYSFIIENETNIKLPDNENIIEKIMNVNITLLRKMLEEDDIIFSTLNNLIDLSEKNTLYSNNLVKSGCPRFLLQIIETSPNKQNVKCALILLKMICNSNEDNLKIISSQNPMNVFFQAKKKFEGDNSIIGLCDDISKDILKLPGQEKYVQELISENINQFNINAKKDFSDKETRQQLLSSLEIINSFVSNQTQIDLINNENEEFLGNCKDITEKTFKEKELDSINEKLVNNELSLLKKINSDNHKYFGYDYIIDKSIDIIKNKSKYQDILITATSEFIKYLSVQSLYEKHISNKIDNTFIDCIFDDIDNYLGNIYETKDLNNILFYLCLYNIEFASYIKQKGGLKNVYEELKYTIDSTDKNSNIMKLNSLKMIYSLCNDKNEIESFVKSGGVDLLNKIIENEVGLFKEYLNDFSKDLYKVREIPNIFAPKNDVNNENSDDENDNIVIYTFKFLLKIIDFDEKYFNITIINDIIFLSEANYPKKDILIELSHLLSKDTKYLTNDENYLFLLLKNTISLKGKYFFNKEFITNTIDKLLEIILPKIFEANNYFTNLGLSLNENSLNNLQLCYLSEIFLYYVKLQPEKQIQIFEETEKFTLDYLKNYKEKENNNVQEDLSVDVIIALMNLICFLVKNKKDNNVNICENMSTFIFICQQYLFKKEYELFTYEFLSKCDSIFDYLEQNEDKTKCYLKYIIDIIPKAMDLINNIHESLSNDNKYCSLEDKISLIFDFVIKYLKALFSNENNNNENTSQIKYDALFTIICELVNDFNKVDDIDENKRKNILNDLYTIILGIIKKLKQLNENGNLNSYQNILFKLLDSLKESKEKFNNFPKIINTIINNLDISQALFDKSIETILNDLKSTPPIELELNLDSLTILSNNANIIENLIENEEFTSIITTLYKDKENLSITQRKNITTIYNNLFKNTYNTEIIINKNPEIIKTVMAEVSQKASSDKEGENKEEQKNELNIVVSILKDKSNADQLFEKNLVTKENINEIITNYENKNENEKNEPLNALKNIYQSFENDENKEKEIVTKEENKEVTKEENKDNIQEENKEVIQEEKKDINIEEKKDINVEENILKEENKDIVKEEIKEDIIKEENKEINGDESKENIKEENKEINNEENKVVIKEENKEIIKEEIKEVIKEENKEEITKEENKENINEEKKEEIKEEKNEDIKEEKKEEIKEENKEVIKEENKEDIKEENKEDIKEENKEVQEETKEINEENKEIQEENKDIKNEEVIKKENIEEEKKEIVKEENKENEVKPEIKTNQENEKKSNIDNFQSEKTLLVKLEEKINQAYEEHLKKLNIAYNEEEYNINFDDTLNEMSELTTITKNRKLSITSNLLINNSEENKKIYSPISVKANENISSSLDNLISLIRLLHLKYKTSTDEDIHKERIDLIKQTFQLLKKYTICPENHQVIIELGLLSFIEKLNKEDEYQIYLFALDVLKNCSYSENSVQSLLLNNYYDSFIQEIIKFYENIQIIKETKENTKCFYYDNIILNNIIKLNQGFENIYNKVGIDKVLIIAKNTTNINIWNLTIINLNNILKDEKQKQELLKPELINDISILVKKVFDMSNEQIQETLFVETLKLVAVISDKNMEDLIKNLEIVKIINSSFETNKNNYNYLESIVYLLKILCSENKNLYNEIKELKLIDKISEQIIKTECKDNLINNFSNLLCNILLSEEKSHCSIEMINQIFDFINKYSEKLEENVTKEQPKKNEDNKNNNLNENNSNTLDENSVKIYNSLLNNYLKIINYFSSDENDNNDIINEKYINTISNTIKKTKLDLENINICLLCLNHYYIKTKNEDWKNEIIQNVYLTLNSLKEKYYSNSDILINISNLVGIILKGLSLKFLIERYYSLGLDCINCQDWNEKLVTPTLGILKDCLTKNEELKNEVFENTHQAVLNLLKLYPNIYSIVLNGYEVISQFCQNIDYAPTLVNADLISLIRSSLLNKSMEINNEENINLRLMIYKVIFNLAYVNDKDINAKISLELMESFITDLMCENYSEYLNEIIKILILLFKNKLSIETFIQKSGLDILLSCLDKFYENKKFILNIFVIIRDILFSSNV